MTASEILDALIALADDKIWASELALVHDHTDRRIDFWTLEPIRSKGFRAQAYEIKVTRADFLRDSLAKQSAALQFANRFWYVTPPDLLKKEEIPEWAGLLEWHGKLFHVKRKAPPREKAEPTWPFIVSVIRNSGEMRRDTGLIKAQLAFFQQFSERRNRQQHLKNSMWLDRYIAKSKQMKKAAEA